METLSRIGTISKNNPSTVYQVCFILCKKKEYYIVHFKELQKLDDPSLPPLTETELSQRNAIAELLQSWELVNILNPQTVEFPKSNLSNIKIVRFSDKDKWTFVPLYNIGQKR